MRFLAKLCVLAVLCSASIRMEAAEPHSREISPAAVQAAVEGLRHDPNLRQDKTVRTLHWVTQRRPPPDTPAPAWIISLLMFLTDSASVAVWAAGATALAVAVVWIVRLIKSKRSQTHTATTVRPGSSRIQNLDIDPNSLPTDIGATALTLLHAGRTRESLSLLYRGALSRVVNRFAVAVGESFTEGEALSAVRPRLDQTRVRYFAALVAQWQSAVYAAESPNPERVATLCRDFATTFDDARII